MTKEIRVNLPKPKKGQKCFLCKKELRKGSWCWNGLHWFCSKCKEKDTHKRISKYLREISKNE